jgi:hypothetical protein
MPGFFLSASSVIRNQGVRLLRCALHETWTRLVLVRDLSLAHQWLAPQFQHVIGYAVVVLSITGDGACKPSLCSSQAKSEEVFHRRILDHPNLFDTKMKRKGYS